MGLGESRSRTLIVIQNLLPASHRLWTYVCAFSLALIVMMAMLLAMAIMMLAMVMVFMMVIQVLEAI
jgi:hypothetical protein